MKKLFLSILLVVTFVLSSCAMAPKEEEITEVPSNIFFDFEYGLYRKELDYDILSDINSYESDFFLMYNLVEHQTSELSPLSETSEQAYRSFLQKLDTAPIYHLQVFSYSSNELKDVLTNHDVTVTTEDIFVFNSIKSIFDTAENYVHAIDRNLYIETLIDTTLTQDEKKGLLIIQAVQTELYYYGDYTTIKDETAEEYIEFITPRTEFSISEQDEKDITEAFNILDKLYKKGED